MCPSNNDTGDQTPQSGEENPDTNVTAPIKRFSEYMAKMDARMAALSRPFTMEMERTNARLAVLTKPLEAEIERMKSRLVASSGLISSQLAAMDAKVAALQPSVRINKAEARLASRVPGLKALLIERERVGFKDPAKWFKLGYPIHDVLAVYSPAPCRTSKERRDAAESLLRLLPYILHHKKRAQIIAVLGEEAVAPERIHELALQHIFIAVTVVANDVTGDPRILSKIAARLSLLITQDLLGPKYWQSARGGVPVQQIPHDKAPELPTEGWEVVGTRNQRPILSELAEAEARLNDLKGALQQIQLTKQERRVLDALQAVDGKVKMAAKALGLKPDSVSAHLFNIRKKIRSLI